jgi:hypothetical protein
MSRRLSILLPAALFGAIAAGCGSSAPAGPVGGPVTDAGDQRCLVNGQLQAQPVGMCLPPGTGAADDAGAGDAAPGGSDFGATLYNSSGYDDDCKYHVSFTSTPVQRNVGVTFTVTAEQLDPAKAATGADLFPEVYLTPTQPSPSVPTTTETPAGSGIYKVGPIVFNAPGLWTVRFHLYENCSDARADSPHGHIAFYIDVP